MKLAYIAQDKNCSRAVHALSRFFSEIDVYILDSEKPELDCSFSELSIMMEQVRISANEGERTLSHQAAFNSIQSEYRNFRKNVLSGGKAGGEVLRKASGLTSVNFLLLNNIRQFSYGRVSGKFVVHSTTDKNSCDYDYFIIQNSQSLTDSLMQIRQNVFSVNGHQEYLVLSLNFDMNYKLPEVAANNSCVYIRNRHSRSIIDNWYICNLQQSALQVSLVVPREQSASSDYLEFITARTREAMQTAFTAFEVGPLSSAHLYDCDGFTKQQIKLKKPKVSAVFPAFTFWSQTEINNYVSSCFSVKNRKEAV